MSRQVRALIELQLLTGARGGELLILRPQDFDTSRKVWVAIPPTHKTAYRGRKRKLYFGTVAQTMLKTFMVRPANSYLFSPKEAEAERYAKAEMHRRKTDQPSCPYRKLVLLAMQRFTESTSGGEIAV